MTCPNGFLYILCDNCDKGQPIFVHEQNNPYICSRNKKGSDDN